MNELTLQIKKKALELGFSACGICRCEPFSEDTQLFFENWLKNGYQAKMNHLERNVSKRLNPKELVDFAQSVIVLTLNYYNPDYHKNKKSSYSFAQYALGADYHSVIKEKLLRLADFISAQAANSKQKIFVDSVPSFEKQLAQRAGLGKIGHNTLLLTEKGSYVFVGEVFTSLVLDYDKPLEKEICLHCNRCVNACPTKALQSPYTLDTTACIAYQTIENKEDISPFVRENMREYIYGCDFCQRACPLNAKAEKSSEKQFEPKKELLDFSNEQWETLTETDFQRIFQNSAVQRAGYEKLKRNIAIASLFSNSGQ
ncbi:MAG: tRNA epoxyqueuosine(34) reductase QueG [Lentimicrobiaceae bacterium]|nr:tRNA epoxyqueuosine(34) reductase QueG [Lentimicrobiaceae bacterium]